MYERLSLKRRPFFVLLKSMKKKKPDNIVYDEDSERYNAAILPYATSVGAPKIEVEDLTGWKNQGVDKVNKTLQSKFDELKEQYNAMVAEYEYNNLVYNARFSFEPIIGNTYYLYLDKKEEYFLSIISPAECKWNFQGEFRLNSQRIWEKIS